MRNAFALVMMLAATTATLAGQEVKTIIDFEDPAELKNWTILLYDPVTEKEESQPVPDGWRSGQYVTHGTHSLRIPGKAYLRLGSMPDLSGYDALDIDVFVEGHDPVSVELVIADREWADHPTGRHYNNRHNNHYTLRPGANVLSIPVNGLFRGHIGLRNIDIKHNVNPAEIVRFDLGFTPAGEQRVTAVFIDNFRLVRETIPEGIVAFDFGPENQAVFPGFQVISWDTLAADGKPGLRRAQPSANRAQADNFPTRLYGDYVEMGDGELLIPLPDGQYHVWAVFNNTAEWPWWVSRFRLRWIESAGQRVYEEDRGPDGPTEDLFLFEKIEPRPGDDMWELYMKHIFKIVRFPVKVTDGQMSLTFRADAGWSCKLCALVVYPESNRQQAEAWLDDIERRNREEFAGRAVFLGPHPMRLAAPEDAVQKGYWLGSPALDQDILLTDAPGAPEGNLTRVATRGEPISFTFAIRPLKDLGPVSLSIGDLTGPDGASTPASQVELRYVHHATQRGFNEIAYTIGPETLRRVAGSNLQLEREVTRQFWIAVNVPDDAKPGQYAGEALLSAGDVNVRVPIRVDVLDLTLVEPEFLMGFFGSWAPGELGPQRQANLEAFAMLRRGGMNTYSGGPGIPFRGLDESGKPILDFRAVDEFFAMAREAGFNRPIYSYGGPANVSGLHDGSHIGATGRRWEQQTGKPFEQILQLVWAAVKEHAEQNNWPDIYYSFVDEPRVLEDVQAILELQRLYRKVAPHVKTGGYYSVHWERDDPLNQGIQEIFRTMVWSGLNVHGQTDFNKAREYGRELHIYNQGRDRFSFGAYQFAEMLKGAKGRIQWHALSNHGYQHFNLDGREPATAMYNWGTTEVMPTIFFYRSREGAYDFRYADTLWRLARRNPDSPAAKEAIAFLESVNRQIQAGQRRPPEGWMGDEAFRARCIEHLRKLQAEQAN